LPVGLISEPELTMYAATPFAVPQKLACRVGAAAAPAA